MAKKPNQSPQTPPEEGNEPAEVYSVSQDQDGSLHFSRRDFLYFSMAVGGTLLLKGVCPRFGADPATTTTTQPVQAGMFPLPKVSLHARPSIESNIVDTLQQNDIVLLIGDHPDLGWVEVSTRAGQQGWLMRRYVDFSRAFTQASRDFGLSSTQTPKPALVPTFTAHLIQSGGKAIHQNKNFVARQAGSCGEAIQNGDFEAGSVSWVEESSHGIITNSWADPYQGSWVALLGGDNSLQDKLTQLFHLPADVQDDQTLEFYLKVTTAETGSSVYDTLVARFLDASGTPISADIGIADNTTPMDWSHKSIQLAGLSNFADQDIQVQFEADTDVSLITNFVIDSVSLNLTCGTIPPTPTAAYYVYLPIIVNGATPTPSNTPTETPTDTPTETTCASYTCSCNTAPCSCNTAPCSCNSYPTGPTATFCACHYGPCSCNSYPTGPTATFCLCNTAPCTCNAFPCSCNYYVPPPPCTCNAFPCSCNYYVPPPPCTCNAFPCSCNYHF